MQFKRAIYWFTNDLRLSDNQALEMLAKQAEQACFVYVIAQPEFVGNLYQNQQQGRAKQLFNLECLHDLSQQLARLGHQLLVFKGNQETAISQLIIHTQADAVFLTEQVGFNERQSLTRLQQEHKQISFVQAQQYTLFNLSEYLDQDNMFKSFTAFRKVIEKASLPLAVKQAEVTLPHNLLVDSNIHFNNDMARQLVDDKEQIQADFDIYIQGGEQAAQQHLLNYFSSQAPSSYKETRNALDDWSSSTKFSAYLASGCVSVKRIWLQVEQYEQEVVSNDSTYWIKFELLWREYFQWLSLRLGKDLFQFGGCSKQTPLTSFYPERFAKWVAGTTPYPIVNACMKQLRQTGYMSNRGRQLVASCLVHELSIDWRYGAAYFEQQLIDYDVAANWGNWQYIAGVGVDPRGGRQFNLAKQTQTYDPDGEFISRWQGQQQVTHIDSTDMVDWPMTQGA